MNDWTSLLNGLVASSGVVVMFGLIVRFQQARINKLSEIKQDRRACDGIMRVFKEDLERGTKKFDGIENTLKEHSDKLTGLSEASVLIVQKVSFLADKNGFGK